MRARDIITGNSTCVTTDDCIAITDDEVGRIVDRIRNRRGSCGSDAGDRARSAWPSEDEMNERAVQFFERRGG